MGNKETSDKKLSLGWIVKTRPGVTAKIYQKLNLSSEKREETFHKNTSIYFFLNLSCPLFIQRTKFFTASAFIFQQCIEKKIYTSLNSLVVHLKCRLYRLIVTWPIWPNFWVQSSILGVTEIGIISMPLVANSVLYSHFASHTQVLTTVATSKSGHSIALLLAQTRICLELRILGWHWLTLIVRILF